MSKSGKKIGRNKPCPCGSRKKYKKCCLNKYKKCGYPATTTKGREL
ncbi:MAG: hypothetical protein D3919_09690 [Candidatus Electrothrix sp. AW5]|nr:hypothetical protein [Candidatus Electrothrix gigas]MCI5225750.1 hypothetical protein [Candidatus Electrothrix gigas]